MPKQDSFIHVIYTKSCGSDIFDTPVASFGRRSLVHNCRNYLLDKLGENYFREHLSFDRIRDFEFNSSAMTRVDGRLIDHNPDLEEVYDEINKIKNAKE